MTKGYERTAVEYWDRKQIAALLGITLEQVRKNERRLGLDKARQDLNKRCVRYDAEIAARELTKRGLIRKI